MLFDSHAHINYEKYTDGERAAVMGRVESSPVAFVLDVGFDMASSRLAARDAAAWPWCYAAVGVHPHDADAFTAADLAELRQLLKAPKVVALGEIGLDYYRDLSPRDRQRDAFRKQIRLALETGVPITIHDRDSGGETIQILKEEGAFSDARKAAFPPDAPGAIGAPDARVLLHCFSGSAEQAFEYIGLGCTISVAGPVTFKNNKKTARVAAEIPLSRLLIETDAPYLTPEPLRGRPNEPVNVELVARKIAELRGISYEETAAATLANARRFFRI
ncbi:MAG: TatD family hydrolase [Clostridiales Family XIII bacterium]|nr:TatD family hydrolase [Clostridiales Family XIII bacterium]